jgi:uncharacterized membrane protein YbhN (UPF0104 family)
MTTTKNNTILRFVDWVNGLLNVKNDKSRKTISLLAIGLFVIGLTVSARRLDSAIAWQFSTAVLTGMLGLLCLTFLVNSLRTHTHSRIVGARLSFGDNAKISLFGSAMNMLPLVIPAGLIMRMSNFVQHGGQAGHVARVFAVNHLLVLASSLLFGFSMLTTTGIEQLQWPLLLVCVTYLGTLLVLIKQSDTRYGLAIGILELIGVIVDAVRIYLCFKLLGFTIEFYQTAVLTISAVLGSAVSIVPAGLGVRELVGAMVSPLISVLPAQAFLAIALNRIFGMAFFVGLSGLVLFTDRSKAQ